MDAIPVADGFEAGQSMQTALIGLKEITAVALDALECLAKCVLIRLRLCGLYCMHWTMQGRDALDVLRCCPTTPGWRHWAVH